VGLGVYLQGGAGTQSEPQSSGLALATLPDVVGMSQDEAQEALEAEGFQVEAQAQESFLGDRGEVLEQSPSGAAEAEEGSTVEIAVGDGPQPASGYALVEHDSGSLTVEVPSSWTDTITDKNGTFEGEDASLGQGVGPAITASTSIKSWQVDGDPVPGVYALASKRLLSEYTVDQLVNSGFNKVENCEAGTSQNFATSLYSGKVLEWTCPTDGSTRYALAAVPEDRECVVMLQATAYSEAHRNDAQRVLNNFEANCEEIS